MPRGYGNTLCANLCVIVYTRALRYILVKSEVEFTLVCSFIKEKVREQDISIYLTHVFLECPLFIRA